MAQKEMLEELLRSRPFVPHRIRFADGSAYDVRHPEFLVLGPKGLHIDAAALELARGKDAGRDKEAARWVPYAEVVGVDPILRTVKK